MRHRRMPIEAESPEQFGYDRIRSGYSLDGAGRAPADVL